MADRSSISFEQAEGAAPLPAQLQLKTVSRELVVRLYDVFHTRVRRASVALGPGWIDVFRDEFVRRQHKFSNEFSANWDFNLQYVRRTLNSMDYLEIFGLLQWIIRHESTPYDFTEAIAECLVDCRAAYRIIDHDTIAPISDPAETEALESALEAARSSGISGARSHLLSATEAATAGRNADCIRESIHAVEAVALALAPGSRELGPALAKLEAAGAIHGALKTAFRSLYGYASDEKGVRHSLLDQDAAKVDESDALFMLGACASFVSYLIAKGRAAKLISD